MGVRHELEHGATVPDIVRAGTRVPVGERARQPLASPISAPARSDDSPAELAEVREVRPGDVVDVRDSATGNVTRYVVVGHRRRAVTIASGWTMLAFLAAVWVVGLVTIVVGLVGVLT